VITIPSKQCAFTVAGPGTFVCVYGPGSDGWKSLVGSKYVAEAVCRHCLQILTAETTKM